MMSLMTSIVVGRKGADGCLSCKKDYLDIRTSIKAIGNTFSNTPVIDNADVASRVREATFNELFRVQFESRMLNRDCGIRLPRVLNRIVKLIPLAHVGRWDEFNTQKCHLDEDLQTDLRESIPGINLADISYMMPKAMRLPEVKPVLKTELTPEEQAERTQL